MTLTILFLVVGIVAMMVAIGRILRGGSRRQASNHHYFRCLECGQKMRYAPSRAGKEAICPRCRHRWTLPATPQPLAKQEDAANKTYKGGRGIVLRKSVRA